jgi:hypothetical protein
MSKRKISASKNDAQTDKAAKIDRNLKQKIPGLPISGGFACKRPAMDSQVSLLIQPAVVARKNKGGDPAGIGGANAAIRYSGQNVRRCIMEKERM